MRKIKIYFASTEEFIDERYEIGDFIRQLNDFFKEEGLFFDLKRDDDLNCVDDNEKKEIEESDYFYIIVGKDIQENTIEEFNIAYEHFKINGHYPSIHTYFVKLPDGTVASESLSSFLKKLRDELKQYTGRYTHIDSIKLNLILELTRAKLISDTLHVYDGQAMIGNKSILNLNNISIYGNNKNISNLKQEINDLIRKRNELFEDYRNNPEDKEICSALSETKEKLSKAKDEIRRIEEATLDMQSCFLEMSSSNKPITWRVIEAGRCLEAGDFEGAMSLLCDKARDDELQNAVKLNDVAKTSISAYINEERLYIKTLSLQIMKEGVISSIDSCYAKCVALAKEHHVEISIIVEYCQFLVEQFNFEKALENALFYKKYTSMYADPDTNIIDFNILLARIYIESDMLDEAQELLDSIKGESKSQISVNEYLKIIDISLIMVSLYIKQGEYVKAEKIIEQKRRSIFKNRNSIGKEQYCINLLRYYIALTSIYQLTGRIDEFSRITNSINEILDTMDLDEENSILVCGGLSVSTQNMLLTEQYKECIDFSQKGLNIAKKYLNTNPNIYNSLLADFYRQQGIAYFLIKQYGHAEETLVKATETFLLTYDNADTRLSNSSALYYLGLVYYYTDNISKAEECLLSLIELLSEDIESMAYTNLDMVVKANELLSDIYKERDAGLSKKYKINSLQCRLKKCEKQKVYEKTKSIFPSPSGISCDKETAEIYGELGDYFFSIKDYKAALENFTREHEMWVHINTEESHHSSMVNSFVTKSFYDDIGLDIITSINKCDFKLGLTNIALNNYEQANDKLLETLRWAIIIYSYQKKDYEFIEIDRILVLLNHICKINNSNHETVIENYLREHDNKYQNKLLTKNHIELCDLWKEICNLTNKHDDKFYYESIQLYQELAECIKPTYPELSIDYYLQAIDLIEDFYEYMTCDGFCFIYDDSEKEYKSVFDSLTELYTQKNMFDDVNTIKERRKKLNL